MKKSKQSLIKFIATNVYEEDYKSDKRKILGRVRNRITKGASKGAFVIEPDGYIDDSKFFIWACNVKGWSMLRHIINQSSLTNTITSVSSSSNSSTISTVVGLPVGIEFSSVQKKIFIDKELQLMECKKKMLALESEFKKVDKENSDLRSKKQQRRIDGAKRY